MKVFCKSCGCHFPEDFEETRAESCSYWPGIGLPKQALENNLEICKKFWDYNFAFDYDAAADRTGIMFSMGKPSVSPKVYVENEFERDIPGYKDWPDDKRRRFQKAWFKKYYELTFITDAIKLFASNWTDQ